MIAWPKSSRACSDLVVKRICSRLALDAGFVAEDCVAPCSAKFGAAQNTHTNADKINLSRFMPNSPNHRLQRHSDANSNLISRCLYRSTAESQHSEAESA